MSSPGGSGGFEYTDDSVVARLSFDVPAQALTDITQLTQAMSAMATQQEAIARSTGTWLDYLNQVPAIAERANQAYRESITQMERMSYIQNEMGGGGQGNVGPTATAGPQGGYSTAAPQGYQNPFAGQMFGMGVTPDLQTVQQQMGSMAGQDPRLFANMMAARGQAINPALLGMVGGAVAGATGQGGMGGMGGGQGYGNAAPGSQSPQATQASRDSSAPPDPAQSGATTRSEPQNIPAQPHEDAPPWQQTMASTISGAQQIVNETRAGGGGGRSPASMLGMASAGMGAAGKFMSDHPNALGGMGGRLGSIAKGAGLVGAGAWGLSKVQDVGEAIQKQTQLGSVQGGDAGTGIAYEAQARIMALNPFITTEQARQAMQMSLSAGFKGGDYDTVQDFMLSNFKDLGMQFADSMSIAKANLTNLGEGETVGSSTASSKDFLALMKDLSRDGGASFTSRVEQTKNSTDVLTSLGVNKESIQRGTLGLQEGYGDNLALRDTIGGISDQAMASPQLMQLAANDLGVQGLLPGALASGLTDAGFDSDQLLENAAGQVAKLVAGQPIRANRISAFQDLMRQQGVNMDWPQAEALYDKVTGSKKPTQQARENVAKGNDPGNRPLMENVGDFMGDLARPFSGPVGAITKALTGDFGGAWDSLTTIPTEDESGQRTKDQFAARGRKSANPPSSAAEAAAQAGPVRTEGQVSGEVRITVDQSGRVVAPQSIQLSGTQRSANAGAGSAQLNNGPPGEGYTNNFPGSR